MRTSVKVSRILKDDEKDTVTGVRLESGERISAKAVVLSTGGFENNVPLRRDWISSRELGVLGSPYNYGDGIKLAQELGAQLWHMSRGDSIWLSPGRREMWLCSGPAETWFHLHKPRRETVRR